MTSIYALVGKKIRTNRKANNFTQEQLGEILQIDQSYIGRIERGEINVTLETISKIAEALNVSPAQLFENNRDFSNKAKSDTLEKIESILYSLDASELLVIHRIIRDVISLKNNNRT